MRLPFSKRIICKIEFPEPSAWRFGGRREIPEAEPPLGQYKNTPLLACSGLEEDGGAFPAAYSARVMEMLFAYDDWVWTNMRRAAPAIGKIAP